MPPTRVEPFDIPDSRPAYPSMGPDYFDFWLGDWDCVTEAGKARNTVTRDYGGAVITERFSILPPSPWSGMSVSVYSDEAGWRQTWVDQDSNYWNFVGMEVAGNPCFATEGRVDRDQLFKRMVFTDIADESLNWRWESSPDLATWAVTMTVSYRRRG